MLRKLIREAIKECDSNRDVRGETADCRQQQHQIILNRELQKDPEAAINCCAKIIKSIKKIKTLGKLANTDDDDDNNKMNRI